jgi:hypothetical protein
VTSFNLVKYDITSDFPQKNKPYNLVPQKSASTSTRVRGCQATRAYVAVAGTAAIGGLARPQAHDIGEAAAHAASYQDGSLTHQEVRMATGRFAFYDFLIFFLGELWMKWLK